MATTALPEDQGLLSQPNNFENLGGTPPPQAASPPMPGITPTTIGVPKNPAGQYGMTKVDTQAVPEYKPTKVADQLQGLLSQENPYIKTARANAAEASNSRGLLNSSIAAGAGEKAAIESAMPIAQQDADAANTLQRNEQAFNYNAALKNAETQNQFGLQSQTFDYNKKLNDQLHQFDYQLKSMELNENERQSLKEQLTTISQQYMNERSAILTSPSISGANKEAYIKELEAYTDQQMRMLVDMSGFSVDEFDNAPGGGLQVGGGGITGGASPGNGLNIENYLGTTQNGVNEQDLLGRMSQVENDVTNVKAGPSIVKDYKDYGSKYYYLPDSVKSNVDQMAVNSDNRKAITEYLNSISAEQASTASAMDIMRGIAGLNQKQ